MKKRQKENYVNSAIITTILLLLFMQNPTNKQSFQEEDFTPEGDGYFSEFVPRGMALSSKFGEYRYFQDSSIMVYVPAGEFFMGGKSFANTQPLKILNIPEFYIDKSEVTISQYKQFCYASERDIPRQPEGSKNNHPVVNITWQDANEYAKWVKKSLPTEAQWEKAARGGRMIPEWAIEEQPVAMRRNPFPIRLYSWGNIMPNFKKVYKCNYRADDAFEGKGRDGYEFTAPVGSFSKHESSVYGCDDLIGNVQEWCADTYEGKHTGKSSIEFKEGGKKVIRGGGWNSDARRCRLSYRTFGAVDYHNSYVGFRLVKNIEK